MIRMAFFYFKYLLFARHRKGHGIHSPFIYRFIRKVLYNEDGLDVPSNIAEWHHGLKKVRQGIETRTIGEKSRVANSKKEQVGRLARYSGVSRKFGGMLYRLVKFTSPDRIIELGTGLGISTAYLAAGFGGEEIISIDASEQKLAFARDENYRLGFVNTVFINSSFEDILSELGGSFENSIVFIDGNHSYNASMEYFRFFSRRAGENTILVFDDINWSDGMRKAWKEISSDRNVSISIDLFFAGLVFFRRHMPKTVISVKF